jgi:hypothetical protein
MTAEHAAILVDFVDHHGVKAFDEPVPEAASVRQNPVVKHIRSRKKNGGLAVANVAFLGFGETAGVLIDADATAEAEAVSEVGEGVGLVIDECDLRGDVERTAIVGERSLKGRDGIGEALPARGPGCEDGVLAVPNSLDRGGLVVVELLDPVVGEGARQARLDIDILERGGPAGELLVKLQLSIVVRSVPEPADGILHRNRTQAASLMVSIPVLFVNSFGMAGSR